MATRHNVPLLGPEAFRVKVSDALPRIGRGEVVEPFTAERMRRDGSRFAARLTLTPVLSATGDIAGATVTVREIGPA